MIPSHSQFQSQDPEPPENFERGRLPSHTYGGKQPEDLYPTGGPRSPRDERYETNELARSNAESDLWDAAEAKKAALPTDVYDFRNKNEKASKEIDAARAAAEAANNEEVDSANAYLMNTSIKALEERAKRGKPTPISGDAVGRARNSPYPQLRSSL